MVVQMGPAMFPNGAPVDSAYNIQNGNFRSCGEIAATSIVQGTLRAKSSRISSRHGTEKRERLCRTCVYSLWSRQSKNVDNYA